MMRVLCIFALVNDHEAARNKNNNFIVKKKNKERLTVTNLAPHSANLGMNSCATFRSA